MSSISPQVMVAGGIFAWAIYRRVRRNIGRQKLRPRRIIVSLVILGVASIIILTGFLRFPMLDLSCRGGMLLGVAGAFLGLRHTRFETTAEGHFYTPNTYIGIGLSALLAGRMIYRFSQLQNQAYTAAHPQTFGPLTLFIIGLTLGYYLAYYIGLFVHTHDRKPSVPLV